MVEEHLRLAHLRNRNPDRPGVELHPGDRRALVRLGVGTRHDAVLAGSARHGGDVRLQRIEIHEQRRGVQVPHRDPELGGFAASSAGLDLGAGEPLHGPGGKNRSGGAGGAQKTSSGQALLG